MKTIGELRELNQWVCWDTQTGKKVPISPFGGRASSTDSTTWATYAQAVECMNVNGYCGVGFVFKKGDGLAGIDLDHCLDENGSMNSFAASIVSRVETYAEISPSGTGIKIIGLCDEDYSGKNTPEIELYTHSRFFAITGECITHDELGDISEIFQEYCSKAREYSNDTSVNWGPQTSSESTLEAARAYLEKMPPSVSGMGGHNALLTACYRMLVDFALTPTESFNLIEESFNGRCDPPWSENEIVRKIEQVYRRGDPKKDDNYNIANVDRDIEGSIDEEGILSVSSNLLAAGSSVRIPKTLLDLPKDGAMYEFASYAQSINSRDSWALSVTAAISWYAACTGRSIMDETGTKTNIYIVTLAPSSGGKQAPQDSIKAVFDRTSNPDIIGGKVTSDAAIGSLLRDNPNTLCIWDEYGLFMQKTKGGVQATINDVMLDLWGAANSRYRLKAYADKEKDITICQPCFSVAGYSTADHFWAGLNRMHLRDGFAGRLMVIDTGDRSPRKQKKFSYPSKKLIDRTQFWIDKGRTPLTDAGIQNNPEAEIIEIDNNAKAVFNELWEEIERYQSDEEQAIWGRAPEKAQKLALIRTLDRHPSEWIVQKSDAEWGVAWARHTSEYMLTEGRKRLGIDGSFDQIKTEVFSMLKQNKGKCGYKELLKMVGCSQQRYESVVRTLVTTGQVKVAKSGSGKVVYLNA